MARAERLVMRHQALAGWAALAAVILAVTLSVFPNGTRGPSPLLPAAQAGAGAPLPGLVQPTDGLSFTRVAPGAGGSLGSGTPEPTARATDRGGAQATPAVPKNYIGSRLELHEAHWQGMDTRKLDRELRRKLKYPRGLQGILVTEVTLVAAKSGLLAGDVIVAVADTPVTTLETFQQATKMIAQRPEAELQLFRKGKEKEGGRYPVRRERVVLRSGSELGFAQLEGAPMILPGDMRPHPERGPCTSCHAIGKGFELTPDPDLIVLPPPPISSASVAAQSSPHADRGPCTACHSVTR
jgi:hypothetical protein